MKTIKALVLFVAVVATSAQAITKEELLEKASITFNNAKETIVTASTKYYGAAKESSLNGMQKISEAAVYYKDQLGDTFAGSSFAQNLLKKVVSAKHEVLGALIKHPVASSVGALVGVIAAYNLFAPRCEGIYIDNGRVRYTVRATGKRMSLLSGVIRSGLSLAVIAGGAIAGSYATDVVSQALAK